MAISKLTKRCAATQFRERIALRSNVFHGGQIVKGLCSRRVRRYYSSMRSSSVAAVAALVIAPMILLFGAPSAHADLSGYRRCVANITQLPITEPDPQNMNRVGLIEQDLKSGATPAAEAQKVAGMGFDQRAADAIVQCVIEENP